MNDVRDKILSLVDTTEINKLSYGAIAEKIGLKYRSQPKYYIERMIDDGILIRTPDKLIVRNPDAKNPSLLLIPVLGKANCGKATIYADSVVEGVLRVSPSNFRRQPKKGTFAVEAVGDSMNVSDINGKTLEDGDLAIVEPINASEATNGDYVLSVIDGMGNIKQLLLDYANNRVLLKSKSRNYYDDIIISREDMYLYSISGRVVDVVKGINA